MRFLILVLTLFISTLNGFAQNNKQTLRETANKRAKKEVAHIATEIELSSKEIVFLEEKFTTKFLYVSTYIKGKDVTNDYKKAIYRKSSEWLETELNKEFSEAETVEIVSIFKNRRDSEKKNR